MLMLCPGTDCHCVIISAGSYQKHQQMTAGDSCASDAIAVSKFGDLMCNSGPLEDLTVRTADRARNCLWGDSGPCSMLRGKSIH